MDGLKFMKVDTKSGLYLSTVDLFAMCSLYVISVYIENNIAYICDTGNYSTRLITHFSTRLTMENKYE